MFQDKCFNFSKMTALILDTEPWFLCIFPLRPDSIRPTDQYWSLAQGLGTTALKDLTNTVLNLSLNYTA